MDSIIWAREWYILHLSHQSKHFFKVMFLQYRLIWYLWYAVILGMIKLIINVQLRAAAMSTNQFCPNLHFK